MSVFSYYPFLREIPEDLLALIDLNTLYLPTAQEFSLLQHLAAEIDNNIVVYKKFYEPKGNHLCRCIQYALLDETQLLAITRVEETLTHCDVVVVAYEKPIVVL
jgi:hypothetical protein